MKNLWIILVAIVIIGGSACSADSEQRTIIAATQIDEAVAKALTTCGEGDSDERAACRETIYAETCADEADVETCIDEMADEWMLLRIRSAPTAFDEALLAFEDALWAFEEVLRVEVDWDTATTVERAIACQTYRTLEDPDVRAVFIVLLRECA